MALKALLFILAFVLLISTKVTSMEEEILTVKQHGGHARAPAHAPVKPPVHSPRKAPAYSPHKSPTPGYGYPPKTRPPAYSPHHNHGKCIPLCLDYCKSAKHSKRKCERACVPCCDEYQCVPGPHQKCLKWDKVISRGRDIPCPK